MPRRIGAAVFHWVAEQHRVEIFSLSLYEIEQRLKEVTGQLEPKSYSVSLTQYNNGLDRYKCMKRELL